MSEAFQRVDLDKVKVVKNSKHKSTDTSGKLLIAEARFNGSLYSIQYFPNQLENRSDFKSFMLRRQAGHEFVMSCEAFELHFDKIWFVSASESQEKYDGKIGYRCHDIYLAEGCDFRFEDIDHFKNTLLIFSKVFLHFDLEPDSENLVGVLNYLHYFEIDQKFDFSFDWASLLDQPFDHKGSRYWRFEP